MKMFYPVIFTKEADGYSMFSPDLDGCFSEGDTFAEAYANMQSAIGLYLDEEKVFPKPSDPVAVADQVKIDQFLCMVEFDMIEYKKKNPSKSVKKTLTIPDWLNEEAEKQHINFSGVLQDALKSKLNMM